MISHTTHHIPLTQTQFREYRNAPFNLFSATVNRRKCLKKSRSLRRITKGANLFLSTMPNRKIGPFFLAYGELPTRCSKKRFRLRRIRKKNMLKKLKKKTTAKNFARPKSRVTLCATTLAAAVAQSGYLTQNVAPAQRRNS